MDELLSIVTVGHVDHGKSTVIGRMLADSGSLPQGKLEAVKENCRRNSKPFEYAFLLDALKNEQAQGITIDTARCFFKTAKRNYIIIDAPGHIEFLKNMVTGASRAEAALLVIDASHGVEENTRRHGYFLSLLGIKQVAVVVNKMDLVGYQQDIYQSICTECGDFLEKIGISPLSYIPVSGINGDNIVFRSAEMAWYPGPTVLEQFDLFVPAVAPDEKPFRMPVQGVYKFTEAGDTRRIIAGTVEAGKVRAGDKIVFWPSGKKTTVKKLEVFHADEPLCFSAGEAAGFTMSEQIFAKRGEIACLEKEKQPQVAVRLKANLFWLGKKPFVPGKVYLFKCGTAKIEMKLEKIERVVNASTLDCTNADHVRKNEAAECILLLEKPCAFDIASESETMSRFVIVDEYEIAGGGIITSAQDDFNYDIRNIRWSAGSVSSSERTKLTGQKGLVVWMTGLSGSGKTTIAEEVEQLLLQAGKPAFILDGDKLRRGLCSDLGFSDQDREENIRRAAETAALFADAGMITLVTLISPFEKARENARRIAKDSFMSVYIKASVETCIQRDPKKLYQKALNGELRSFTGIDSPYEIPVSPDFIVDTEKYDEISCAEMLFEQILSKLNQ